MQGNSNDALYYDFYNRPNTASIHYYRLKQTNLDGTFHYSNIIALSDKTISEEILLYPNPATESINLQIPASLLGQTYEIYNIAGQFVKNGILLGNYHVINLETMPQGFYLLLIDNGAYQKKFSIK